MSEIKIRLISNWCENDHLRELWNRMTPKNDYKWNSIKVIPSNDETEEDYFIIINYPKPTDKIVLSKSILFYMEPRQYILNSAPEYDEDNPMSDKL